MDIDLVTVVEDHLDFVEASPRHPTKAGGNAGWIPLGFATDAVAVPIQVVDVVSDDRYRSPHIGGPVPASSGTIDVTVDWHTGPAVVRIAVRL
jgi:hypothetical protein